MKKIKATIITDGIYPYSMGGSHRFVYELLEKIDNKKYNVTCIVPEIDKKSDFAINQTEIIPSFKVIKLKTKFKNKFLRLFISFYSLYQQSIKTVLESDIINIHYLPALFNLRNITSKQKKIYYTFHGPWSEEFNLSIIGKLESKNIILSLFYKFFFKRIVRYILFKIEKNSFNHVSEFMCLSEYMKNKLINTFKIDEEKIKIIHSGVDINTFKIVKNKTFRKKISHGRKFVFITVRRLEKRMGLNNLIIACNMLKKKNSDFILNICGKGNYHPYLKRQIKKLKLDDHVKLYGFVDDDILVQMLSNSDLFILPSIDLEGFGLVILESMACGTPVLSSPHGGSKEIISILDNNLIMSSARPEDILNSLKNFIENKIIINDDNFYRKFVYDNFSWSKATNEYLNWIKIDD